MICFDPQATFGPFGNQSRGSGGMSGVAVAHL